MWGCAESWRLVWFRSQSESESVSGLQDCLSLQSHVGGTRRWWFIIMVTWTSQAHQHAAGWRTESLILLENESEQQQQHLIYGWKCREWCLHPLSCLPCFWSHQLSGLPAFPPLSPFLSSQSSLQEIKGFTRSRLSLWLFWDSRKWLRSQIGFCCSDPRNQPQSLCWREMLIVVKGMRVGWMH